MQVLLSLAGYLAFTFALTRTKSVVALANRNDRLEVKKKVFYGGVRFRGYFQALSKIYNAVLTISSSFPTN